MVGLDLTKLAFRVVRCGLLFGEVTCGSRKGASRGYHFWLERSLTTRSIIEWKTPDNPEFSIGNNLEYDKFYDRWAGLASASTSERDERTKPITTNEKIFFNGTWEKGPSREEPSLLTLYRYIVSGGKWFPVPHRGWGKRMREGSGRSFWIKILNSCPRISILDAITNPRSTFGVRIRFPRMCCSEVHWP